MYIWAREGAKRLWNRDFDYSLTPRQKVAYRQLAYGLGPFGAALEARDRMGYYDDYLRNRGMTWSDVKYPFALNIGMERVGSSTLGFVSSNVSRLYHSDVKQRVSRAYDRGYRNANNYWRGYIRGSR